jgi:phosphohistidine phosphatase
MCRLLLLRHAKAERSKPGEKDHDRVLTPRGHNDAGKLGAYMARHNFTPDLVVVSTAARTRETWTLAAAAFADQPVVKYDGRIYEASPAAILTAIKETEPQVGTLLVIGHNPGLQELAAQLVATGGIDARQNLMENFPTAALAVIDFAVDDWSRLHAQGGRLEHFVTPRTLAPAND